jgi:hypothetical protein
VNDLSKWAIMQMNNGNGPENKQLFSEKEHDEMWQLQTIIQQELKLLTILILMDTA